MRKMPAVFLALCLVLASASNGYQLSAKAKEAAAEVSQVVPGAQVTKRALLVGINRYRNSSAIPNLSGSINDVEDMKALLIGKFNFAPENIMVLTDEKATHAGIISAFENHLISKTRTGDIVVFHYSGHGSQMKDVTGESPSGLDETLVPYDSRDPENKVFDISGSELKPLFRRLAEKTTNVTVILDSCHSGTLVKAIRPVRMIPPDQRQPPPVTRSADAIKGLGVGLSPKLQNRFLYALIAAASSREVAFEHVVEGKQHGALTYFLTRALRNAGAGVTYRDIMDVVTGTVTLNFSTQHPQLEGLQADQHVFGDSDSTAETYVLASPSPDGRVSLQAGQVYGITAGSIFEIYAPGTKRFETPSTTKIQVTDVMPFAAYGKLLSGSGVQNFSRAIEREHSYNGMQLFLYFDPASDSAQFRSLRNAVSSYKHVQVATDLKNAHLLLKRDAERLLTLGADQTPYSPPLQLIDTDLELKFKAQIDQWARWFNVLSIHNANPAISAGIAIKTKKDGQTRDPFAQIGPLGPTVFEGEQVEVTVSNKSTKDLYFALLDLQTDGSITLIYPPAGTHEVLKASGVFSRTFYTYLPQGKTEVIDVVMLMASVREFNAEAITRPPVREVIPTDSIGKLLAYARGLRPDPPASPIVTNPAGSTIMSSGPIRLDDWVTDQKVLKVRAN